MIKKIIFIFVFLILINSTSAVLTDYSIADASVTNNYPNTNYGSWNVLDVGKNEFNYWAESFIKFPNNIPSGKVIDDAKCHFYFENGDVKYNINLYLCKATSDWSESGITWNNKPDSSFCSPTKPSYSTGTYPVGYLIFDCTELVRDAYNNNKDINLVLNSVVTGYPNYLEFRSKEYGSYKPYIAVHYSTAKCSDGTYYGDCSSTRPKYCDNGNLIDRCDPCGCNSGYDCMPDNSCKKQDGQVCSNANECSGDYCVHNVCSSSSFIAGDGYCDSAVGEGCANSADCGCENVCDTIKNECVECLDGETKACPLQQGVCSEVNETCINNTWSGCNYGYYYESNETSCDGIDNNCDGLIDEGVKNTCTNYADCTSYQTCESCPAPPEEICDGLDNNCNNETDEGCLNGCQETIWKNEDANNSFTDNIIPTNKWLCKKINESGILTQVDYYGFDRGLNNDTLMVNIYEDNNTPFNLISEASTTVNTGSYHWENVTFAVKVNSPFWICNKMLNEVGYLKFNQVNKKTDYFWNGTLTELQRTYTIRPHLMKEDKDNDSFIDKNCGGSDCDDNNSLINPDSTADKNCKNDAPFLNPIDQITVNEGDIVEITANAADPENDNLTYSINDLRFIQNNNVFTWQTTENDAGNYTVMVSASDGNLTTSQNVLITVLNTVYTSIEAESKNVLINKEFNVSINLNSSSEIYGVQFNLYFNPVYLEAVSVEEGNYLKSDGSDTFVIKSFNNSRGKIEFADSRIAVQNGVNGYGSVAVIIFKAKQEGITKLNLSNVEISDANANPVIYSTKNGLVEIQTEIVDNDNDGFSITDCNDNNASINPDAVEVCNGIDDNCNNEIDEGVLNACGTCGSVPEEICDGIDNNCNNQTDENNVCNGCIPSTEICDGQDNNCDGTVDEGCECITGETYSENCGTGACQGGFITKECVDGKWSSWSECSTANKSSNEICNGIDDDCDGVFDEGDVCNTPENCGSYMSSCYYDNANALCIDYRCNMGSCYENYYNIDGKNDNGCEYYCEKTNNGIEICDNKDNDCDNIIDENCLEGDVNNDKIIDVQDLAKIAKHYNVKKDQSGYSNILDVNKDGVIDIQDLAKVAKNFGKVI